MADVRFESMKNGYNRYQVDDKIEQLTQEIATLQKKLELYSARLDEVEKQSKEYKDWICKELKMFINQIKIKN